MMKVTYLLHLHVQQLVLLAQQRLLLARELQPTSMRLLLLVPRALLSAQLIDLHGRGTPLLLKRAHRRLRLGGQLRRCRRSLVRRGEQCVGTLEPRLHGKRVRHEEGGMVMGM